LANFKDLFSKQSKEYAASRPSYPLSLFEFLIRLVEHKAVAWDCATGNGQAASVLGEYFGDVIASDASIKQIENARARPNVHFAVFSAEKSALRDESVDLITIAQALHWFHHDDFFGEAKRVARKGAIIAAWTYGPHSINPEVDKVSQLFYNDIVGPFWPPEVRYVENRYEDIPFPFPNIKAPDFKIELQWDMNSLMGYFYSWSSTQKYMEKNNSDPVRRIYRDLKTAWGQEQLKRTVTWPLYLKVGRL
jgi:hypothetical protein